MIFHVVLFELIKFCFDVYQHYASTKNYFDCVCLAKFQVFSLCGICLLFA